MHRHIFSGAAEATLNNSPSVVRNRGARGRKRRPHDGNRRQGGKAYLMEENHAMGMTEQRYRTELPEIHRLPSRLRSNTSSTPQKYTTSDVAGSGTVLNHIVKKPAAERAACRPVV